MRDKTSLAARAGCRRKNPEACALVNRDWPAEDRLAAIDWNCQVQRSECDRLGAEMLAVRQSVVSGSRSSIAMGS